MTLLMFAWGLEYIFAKRALAVIEPLTLVFFKYSIGFVLVLFIALMVGFVIFPIITVRRSEVLGEYRSDYILFIVSVTQLITSIILNTWFLTILYGQAVTVLLPARIITNIFLIPLYTIALVGLLKVLPKFVKK